MAIIFQVPWINLKPKLDKVSLTFTTLWANSTDD